MSTKIQSAARLLGQRGGASTSERKAESSRRNGKLGGRPRSTEPRCPCGKNTLKRAQYRGFDCCKKSGIRKGKVTK